MWFLIFTFLVITFSIAWMLFGYFIVLYAISLFKRQAEVRIPEELPAIALIIPCYNEEHDIRGKVKNIRQLQYPRQKLDVVFVDGLSTDGTLSILEEERAVANDFRILQCPVRGKIAQINFALTTLSHDIIVNTDVDAHLESDALQWIVAEFAADENISVVGTYCTPSQTIPIENYYWDSQNKGRLLECDAGYLSIVVAPCYAFKRELLAAFPKDTIADDVFIAHLAASEGKNIVYSRRAAAVETRTPRTHRQFLLHKFRKSNAFLRESLRFLYRLPYMSMLCKITFLTRIAQQVVLSWVLVFWGMLAGALLTMFRYDVVLFGACVLATFFLCTSLVFSLVRLPDGKRHHSILTQVEGYFLINLILLATSVSFPFVRQDSSYSRLGNRVR
jgi:cellulose synthase/poly-beta-1,6-N-acetylglucosamine synthase-like glycosyltransferase